MVLCDWCFTIVFVTTQGSGELLRRGVWRVCNSMHSEGTPIVVHVMHTVPHGLVL